MKTMTCLQLGGACNKTFTADSFEAIAELSKQHGMEMFQQKDEAHLLAMEKMKSLMQEPGKMKTGLMKKESNLTHFKMTPNKFSNSQVNSGPWR